VAVGIVGVVEETEAEAESEAEGEDEGDSDSEEGDEAEEVAVEKYLKQLKERASVLESSLSITTAVEKLE
jgi:hypothetical protein